MLDNMQKLPGYQVNEYQLILDPHEELKQRILQVKKDFFEHFDAPAAWWGKPMVTLARFSQLEMMEERILHRLRAVAMGHHPMKVELKDFGSFPAHSIFIQVATREPIRRLVRAVKENQRLLKLDQEHKPHFIDEPHIGICTRLLPWQYEKAWLDYSTRHFSGRFIAASMLLLKRRLGSKAYQVIERFEFMNLPVSTRQGQLFA